MTTVEMQTWVLAGCAVLLGLSSYTVLHVISLVTKMRKEINWSLEQTCLLRTEVKVLRAKNRLLRDRVTALENPYEVNDA